MNDICQDCKEQVFSKDWGDGAELVYVWVKLCPKHAIVDEYIQEIEQLKSITYCAYCGQEFPLDDKVASKVTEHIYTCEVHPMREIEKQRDALIDLLKEWRETPFFENKADWEMWVYNYGQRVDDAISEIERMKDGVY